MSKPKAPKEDPSTIALRERQVRDLAKLDEEENLRIKQLLSGQRGSRFFRGAPATRAQPGNRAGSAAGGVFGGGAGGAGGVGGLGNKPSSVKTGDSLFRG